MPRPICIIHTSSNGDIDYLFHGDLTFLVIDDRCPSDRIYQLTIPSSPETISSLIGNDEIGSRFDSRHAALSNRILSALEGKPHLSEIYDDNE